MFRFQEKSRRSVKIEHSGDTLLIEISPEWNLLFPVALLVVYASTCIRLASLPRDFSRAFDNRLSFEMGLLVVILLLVAGLLLRFTYLLAMELAGCESIRVTPTRGVLAIESKLWIFRRGFDVPVAEIRDLRAQHSNWLNGNGRPGIEFNHQRHCYQFAKGVSREGRAKIVNALEAAGVHCTLVDR